jgi:hypothetical protein
VVADHTLVNDLARGCICGSLRKDDNVAGSEEHFTSSQVFLQGEWAQRGPRALDSLDLGLVGRLQSSEI